MKATSPVDDLCWTIIAQFEALGLKDVLADTAAEETLSTTDESEDGDENKNRD
jgi:hypothetical protein